MKYDELLTAGRGMSAKMVEDSIRGLARDPRFAAVVALLENAKQEISDASCDVKFAAEHGLLAHGSGGRFAIWMVQGKLKKALEPARKNGEQKPQEE